VAGASIATLPRTRSTLHQRDRSAQPWRIRRKLGKRPPYALASGPASVEHADSGDHPSATSLRIPPLNRHYAAASMEFGGGLNS
jgi:hypothetical protein